MSTHSTDASRPREHRGGDKAGRPRSVSIRASLLALAGLALLASPLPGLGAAVQEELTFNESLARVDAGLRQNPAEVPTPVLEACRNRRNFALQQQTARQTTRAMRSLAYCFDLLKIHGWDPTAKVVTPAESEASKRAHAAAEIEKALTLEPDLDHGRAIYRDCAKCHEPEGWGLVGGYVPQIAGQHRSVLVKQLADIRAGNRDGVLMLPYASVEAIGGPQAVADVTGYIDSLEMSIENGKGPGRDLELGARLYADNCSRCHGANGEGDAEAFVPRLQAQHYGYLQRQFAAIRSGKRRNANAEMRAQIAALDEREALAILDWVSRLEPPIELQAPPGWHNPDFAQRPQISER